MHIRDSCRTLQASLQASGQALDCLDPWQAWKTFKAFLRVEIEDGCDAASLQFLPVDPDPDLSDEATLMLVRQYSERAPKNGVDELIGRVVLELRYAGTHFASLSPFAAWTLDFPTLEEWASVVEGQACFQKAMARSPVFTEVYYDEGAEGDG